MLVLSAVLRIFCFALIPVRNVTWAPSTVSMCTLEQLIMSMMKHRLACNIVCSTKTHSSNRKRMSPLLLRGYSRFDSIRKFLYNDGIMQWGLLRLRGERYGRFSLQEEAEQRCLNLLHGLHCHENSLLHVLQFVVSSRQSWFTSFSVPTMGIFCDDSPNMFKSAHNT
jgi:hypothetical protein